MSPSVARFGSRTRTRSVRRPAPLRSPRYHLPPPRGPRVRARAPEAHHHPRPGEVDHKLPNPPELRGDDPSTPPAEPSPASDIAVTVDRRGSGRPKLLLLDDIYWVEKSQAALEKAFALSVTTSPLEAMLLLAEQRPPFALIELNLKGISGLEVVKTHQRARDVEGRARRDDDRAAVGARGQAAEGRARGDVLREAAEGE